jgi:hypothetical protein
LETVDLEPQAWEKVQGSVAHIDLSRRQLCIYYIQFKEHGALDKIDLHDQPNRALSTDDCSLHAQQRTRLDPNAPPGNQVQGVAAPDSPEKRSRARATRPHPGAAPARAGREASAGGQDHAQAVDAGMATVADSKR